MPDLSPTSTRPFSTRLTQQLGPHLVAALNLRETGVFRLLVMITAMLCGVLAAIAPARRAAQLDPAQAVSLVAPELIALVDFQLRGAGQGIGLGPARPFLFGEEIQGGSVFLVFCHGYIYYELNPNSCWRLPNVGGNSHRFRHGIRRQIISARDPCHG